MSPETVLIRPLEAGDIQAALEIQSKAYPELLLEGAEAFTSRLEAAAPFCLAASLDGKLAGYLLAHGWPRQSPPPLGTVLPAAPISEVLYIHDLAIAPAARGLELGRRMVEHAFELAARQGLSSAELIAVAGAEPYWRTLGFARAEVSAELAAKIATYGSDARLMAREFRAQSLPGA